MEIMFRAPMGRALFCQVLVSGEEKVNKKICVTSDFPGYKLVLVSSISGVNSDLSWDDDNVYLGELFLENKLLILLLRGNNNERKIKE